MRFCIEGPSFSIITKTYKFIQVNIFMKIERKKQQNTNIKIKTSYYYRGKNRNTYKKKGGNLLQKMSNLL